ncbi:PAS domain S-box protein [Microvirga roseola]|uniref:PAS domain S-box protein n=1 Tax=Microvirga roseola TaxID=2883126 RepID=UPI001E43EF54|nr:PAS domain S-box protein [Microvirga roseola]
MVGFHVRETPLDVSFCAAAIHCPDLLVIPDVGKDHRFRHILSAGGEIQPHFYAGAVLRTEDGLPLATLCVADSKARPEGLTQGQIRALRALARAVMRELNLRRDNTVLVQREKELTATIDAMPHMTWVASADGTQEHPNRHYYEFTGAAPGSINGEGWNTVAHPDDREQTLARWRHSLETGEEY